MNGIDFMDLEVVHQYLLGNIKLLYVLLVFMAFDIVTGLFKAAIVNKNLWSRKGLFGYARKMLVLLVIVMANILDQVLHLNGVLSLVSVWYYIGVEGLSISENLKILGVPLPKMLDEALAIVEKKGSVSLTDEIKDELAGGNVERQMKERSVKK